MISTYQRTKYLIGIFYLSMLSAMLYSSIPNTVTGLVDDTNAPFRIPQQIVFTPDGTKAYIINYDDLEVDVVDVATGVVTGTVDDSFSSFDFPHSLAITPDGTTLYVANDYMDEVDIIDTTTDIMTAKVTDNDNLFDYPISLSMTSDGATLYCLNGDGSYDIIIIDVASNTVTGSISGSSFTNPVQIAVNPNDNNMAYVVDPDHNTNGAIFIVDLQGQTVTGTVTDIDSVLDVPYAIVFSPDGTLAFVANNEGNPPSNTGSVVVIDVASNTVINNIISNDFLYPQGIAILPSGLLVYVSNNGDGGSTSYGSVFIIDATTQQVTGIVTDPDVTFHQPVQMGISPDGQTMYVSNSDSNTVSIVFTIIPILPPVDLTGQTLENNFLTQIDIINKLTWQAPASGTTPAYYAIYRDEQLSKRIGLIPADTLEFFDHNRQYNTLYNYYVISIDADQNASTASHVAISTPRRPRTLNR